MIKFLGENEAKAAFGHAQKEYGARFVSRDETIKYFGEVREWSKNSGTAQTVIKTVEDSAVEVNFIGMHGGFQCFDDSADNHATGKGEPTIYIDVRGRLNVFVRKPHERHLSRSEANNPTMVMFDNRIALLHELGHAKQFIERPGWYAHYGDAAKRNNHLEMIEDAARKFWTNKFSPQITTNPVNAPAVGVPRMGGGPPPPPPPPGGLGGPPPLPGQGIAPGGLSPLQKVGQILPKRSERPKALSWFAVIDIDNIQQHEWPICLELGLPLRFNYTDLSV